MKYRPVISCEHAGCLVPEGYNHLFATAGEVLQSHRGWDPGALEIAAFLSSQLQVPLFKCEQTRLLIEPNRSLVSPSLFSEYTQGFTDEERAEVVKQYYYPHRQGVEEWIVNAVKPVLHLSIHSFTPVFQGVTRSVDVGLLFDPDRTQETAFCNRCQQELQSRLPSFNIDFNEPYKGIDDGFTTHLRTLFPDDVYLGIEIEVNQKFVGKEELDIISTALLQSLQVILQ